MNLTRIEQAKKMGVVPKPNNVIKGQIYSKNKNKLKFDLSFLFWASVVLMFFSFASCGLAIYNVTANEVLEKDLEICHLQSTEIFIDSVDSLVNVTTRNLVKKIPEKTEKLIINLNHSVQTDIENLREFFKVSGDGNDFDLLRDCLILLGQQSVADFDLNSSLLTSGVITVSGAFFSQENNLENNCTAFVDELFEVANAANELYGLEYSIQNITKAVKDISIIKNDIDLLTSQFNTLYKDFNIIESKLTDSAYTNSLLKILTSLLYHEVALQFLLKLQTSGSLIHTAEETLLAWVHIFLQSQSRQFENFIHSLDVQIYELLNSLYLGVLGTVIPIVIFSISRTIIFMYKKSRFNLSVEFQVFEFIFRTVLLISFALSIFSYAALLVRMIHINERSSCTEVMQPIVNTTIIQFVFIGLQLLIL